MATFKRQKIGPKQNVSDKVVFEEFKKEAAKGDWIGMITEKEIAEQDMYDLKTGKVDHYEVNGYIYTYEQ